VIYTTLYAKLYSSLNIPAQLLLIFMNLFNNLNAVCVCIVYRSWQFPHSAMTINGAGNLYTISRQACSPGAGSGHVVLLNLVSFSY